MLSKFEVTQICKLLHADFHFSKKLFVKIMDETGNLYFSYTVYLHYRNLSHIARDFFVEIKPKAENV